MWPFLTDPPSVIEFIFLITCVPMGVSHIIRPRMWVEFFAQLNTQGQSGVTLKALAIEFWPGVLVVTLHQVWWGPGILLTIYGWAQFTKVWLALLVPAIGARSMAMVQTKGTGGFVAGGVLLIVVGLSAGVALFWF